MPQTMMRTTEARSQINPVYKSAVRRRGSAAKGCLIALAVALVLAAGVAVFVAVSWRSWAADIAVNLSNGLVDAGEMTDADAEALKQVNFELGEEFKAKRLTQDELARVVEDAIGPTVLAGAMLFIEQKHVGQAEDKLTPEEAAEASVALRRVAQGLLDKQISVAEAEDVITPLETVDAQGNDTIAGPESVTAEQLLAVSQAAKKAADDAGVPEAPRVINLGAEYRQLVEESLGRTLGAAPADPASGTPPADSAAPGE